MTCCLCSPTPVYLCGTRTIKTEQEESFLPESLKMVKSLLTQDKGIATEQYASVGMSLRVLNDKAK